MPARSHSHLDRHPGRFRDGDRIERNAVEEGLDVGEGVDRDPDLADLAACLRRVGIVAQLGRKIERNRETVDAVGQQVAVALIRFGRGREAGILAHRPVASAVHVAPNAAGERKRTRRRTLNRRLGRIVVGLERNAACILIAGAHGVSMRRPGR